MLLNNLTAISPVDGRYSSKTVELRPFFSEFALMKYRLRVEIEWFIFLSLEKNIKDLPPLSKNEIKKLRSIYENFSLKDSKRVKTIKTLKKKHPGNIQLIKEKEHSMVQKLNLFCGMQ